MPGKFASLENHGELILAINQEEWSETLVEAGLYAAMSMQWLQQRLLNYKEQDSKALSAIQRTFEKIVTDKGTGAAVQILAEAMYLALAEFKIWPDGESYADFWSQQNYGATCLEQFGNLIAGQMREELSQEGATPAAFLALRLYVSSINGLDREELMAKVRAQSDAGDPFANLTDPAHSVAMIAVEQGIIFCDPNCGVYQVPWENGEAFFGEFLTIYQNILADSSSPEDPSLIISPQLRGIFRIKPK